MDCLIQICIESIGGLESKKGKNLIDILSGEVEQPSFFIRTSGTLGRNVIRFSTAIKRKRHQIIWQQNFYRRASGLRVEWEDQFVKDKSQIPVSKPRSGVVNDGKSNLRFEFVRIDKFESDCIIAIADINLIPISIFNAGTGDMDSIRALFEKVYPFQLQGSLVGDIGNHDLSLRASICCVPTVIPIMFTLPVTQDVSILFDIVIKEARNVPIKILKASTSFYCMIGSERSNAVLSPPDKLDPRWDETLRLTVRMNPSISKTNLSRPYLTVKLCDHRGNGVPEHIIGQGVLTLWDFFSGISADKDIRVPLLRSQVEGEPASSDSRGFLVLKITEPSLTHESANVLHNAYHDMAMQKIDDLFEQSRSKHSASFSTAHIKIGEAGTHQTTGPLVFNGSRHLKCLIICCTEDCDDEKALLESDVLVKVRKILATLDVGVEFCPIYFDPEAYANLFFLRLLVQRIFECEICIFVLGLVPGALVDYTGISDVFETDFDGPAHAWMQSHHSELEEQEESLIEVLSQAAESRFREDPFVTEKVLLFRRQLAILENKLPDRSDYALVHLSETEMAKTKVYNAAAVDRISRRIASFGASCFTHNDADSFISITHEKIVASIKTSRLNGFHTHSLLNSSIFELQLMRSADSKASNCHSFAETHAFKTITMSLASNLAGSVVPPMFITSEDSLSSKYLYCALCNHLRSNNFKNLGSDVSSYIKNVEIVALKPCFLYDFSVSAGSKMPVAFLRALLQGLRAILASEPCNLIDHIACDSGSTSNELIVLVKPLLKAAIEEYASFTLLFSGVESLDPAVLKVILSILPPCTISGLWVCLLLGSRDVNYSCRMQSVFFAALPCACMCAVVRSPADNDAALVLIEECGIKHSSLGIVLKKFRSHPNLCSIASFLSAVSQAFSTTCGADTTQMFIQLAQSTPASSTFTDILCDILLSMHSFDHGSCVFQFLMLCSRSRYGLQPSDLIFMTNVPSSIHVVCVDILRAIGACTGNFCIVPFYEIDPAIEKVLAMSADPRNAIRLCDLTLLKHFCSAPVKWNVVENLIYISEVTGDFSGFCRRLLECSMQHYIVSNEFCIQDFRSFWEFFCKHPGAESISQRTKLLNHFSGIRALKKESCDFIVVATKFCSSISLYETSDSILKSFKELYHKDLDENVAKLTSDDWSRLCIVLALQGKLSLAWGRLDAAESTLKEALTAHGSAVHSDQVASDSSPVFDASRAVCGRLLSEIASILLVRNRTREALSFADKSMAFIEGIEPKLRSKFLSPSCVLDILMCAMEARLANNLKTGAFTVIDSALKVCNADFGKFHPRSITVYERLCSLNGITDNIPQALVMYERTLQDLTSQREWGFDVTGKLTTILLLISDILVTNHEMSEAVAMCECALKFRTERNGEEPSLQIARCLEKLAACRMHAKDPKEAARNLRDAFKIRQALCNSKKDQDYYMCVLQLSGALKAAGFRSEARQHLKEWVEHLKAELGDDHEFVHTALDIIHSRMND